MKMKKETKKMVAVRVYPTDLERIKKLFKSLQRFIDLKLKELK